MKAQTSIEDVERVAWYARLAFGSCQEKPSPPQAESEKSKVIFQVMP